MVETSGLCCKCCSCCNCFCAFLWLILVGWELFLLWCIFGLVSFITIIGIKNGCKCFEIACFVLWPFKKKIEVDKEAKHCCGCFGSLIWIIFGGFEIILFELLFCGLSFVTIIGIPFGIQLCELIKVTFWPYSVKIVKDSEKVVETKEVQVTTKTETERIEIKQK